MANNTTVIKGQLTMRECNEAKTLAKESLQVKFGESYRSMYIGKPPMLNYKLDMDFKLIAPENDPIAPFAINSGTHFLIDPSILWKISQGFSDLASASGLYKPAKAIRQISDKGGSIVAMWGIPTHKAPVKSFETLASLMQATSNGDGVWAFQDHYFDIVNFKVDGIKICDQVFVGNNFGGIQYIDDKYTIMYLILSTCLGRLEYSGGLHGSLRHLQEVCPGLFMPYQIGLVSPKRQQFEDFKIPVWGISFGTSGLYSEPLITEKGGSLGAADMYSMISSKYKWCGAHAQGKYFLPFKVIGTRIDSMDDLFVHVPSTKQEKGFKRQTLNVLQACRVLGYVPGKMLREGKETYGKPIQVLLMRSGTSLPYLGALVSLKSRHEIGKLLPFYRENLTVDRVLTPGTISSLPVGTDVKRGDVVAHGPGGYEMVTSRDGVVLLSETSRADGITKVVMNVGWEDRSGQLKIRSEVIKGSVTYLDFQDPNGGPFYWEEVFKIMGEDFTGGKTQGNIAIIGLPEGADPAFALTQDSVKATDTGNAMGRVSLYCETFNEVIDYNVEDDTNGKYNEKVAKLDNETVHKIKYFVSVDKETFEDLKSCQEAGKLSKNASLHEVKGFYIFKEECDAHLVMDLVQVESLSVPDNLTDAAVPLEVAAAASGMVDPHGNTLKKVAQHLLDGTNEQANSYARLHAIKNAKFIPGVNPDGSILLTPNKLDTDGSIHPDSHLIEFTDGTNQFVNVFWDRMLVNDAYCEYVKALANKLDELPRPIVLARLDAEDNVTAHLIIDPKVIADYGYGEGEHSVRDSASNAILNFAAKNWDAVTGFPRSIKLFNGRMNSLCKSTAVAKRVFRGIKGVSARTRGGFIPSDYMAISYYGSVAKRLLKITGYKSVDDLVDVVTLMYRAPQITPVFQKICFPDAPKNTLAYMRSPVRYGDRHMEPHTIYISSRATASDNGDHDGDSRTFVPILDEEAAQEALRFDWNNVRKAVVDYYQLNPQDPAVFSFQHESKKDSWAKPGKMTLSKLIELTHSSIVNQTAHIGTSYNWGHAATVFADMLPKTKYGVKAQALMQGHYEEQLAGYNEKFAKFHSALRLDPETNKFSPFCTVGEWENHMLDLTAEIGHTEEDWDTVNTVRKYVGIYTTFARTGKLPQDDERVWLAGVAGVARDLSRGNISSKLIKGFLMGGVTIKGAHFMDIMKGEALKGRVVAQAILRFYNVVSPFVQDLVDCTDDEDFGD